MTTDLEKVYDEGCDAEMATQPDDPPYDMAEYDAMQEAVHLAGLRAVEAATIEACAQECDALASVEGIAQKCAKAIRAMGGTG